jgi:hypothetical protein
MLNGDDSVSRTGSAISVAGALLAENIAAQRMHYAYGCPYVFIGLYMNSDGVLGLYMNSYGCL